MILLSYKDFHIDYGGGFLKTIRSTEVNNDYVNGLNDPEVNKFLVTVSGVNQSIESVRSFVQSNYESSNGLLFGIWAGERKKLIGTLRIHAIEYINYSSHIGICIFNKNYWGKGIAHRAIDAATNWAFNNLNLRWLEAGIYSSNIGSKRAFEKANYLYKFSIYDKYVIEGDEVQVDVYAAKNNFWNR